MKLVLEVDQQVVHQQSESDRNPKSCQQQSAGLVDANLFCIPQLGIEGLEFRPDRRHHGHLSPVESKS